MNAKTITETIYDAQTGRYEIPQVSETYGDFDIPKAYLYQKEIVDRYIAEGKRIVGYKMGLTSRSKMEQMGVDAPIHGVLFEDMFLEDLRVDYSRLIHPKAEPEIAFKLAEDIALDAGPEEIEAAIGFVAPAIDIIDSRYKDFKFTMADVVADNCSSAQFAIGEWMRYEADEMKIDKIKAELIIGSEKVSEGVSSAVLGSPLEALIELHKSMALNGEMLLKDQIVLTGAITAASMMQKGDVITNRTDSLGEITIR